MAAPLTAVVRLPSQAAWTTNSAIAFLAHCAGGIRDFPRFRQDQGNFQISTAWSLTSTCEDPQPQKMRRLNNAENFVEGTDHGHEAVDLNTVVLALGGLVAVALLAGRGSSSTHVAYLPRRPHQRVSVDNDSAA